MGERGVRGGVAGLRGTGPLPGRALDVNISGMSTFAEIEAAADALSTDKKEELLRFLAMSLRKERTTPSPRIYSDEELATMLAEDEDDGKRFREDAQNLP